MIKRQFTFKGNHFEIGKQVGLVYKKWGRTRIPNLSVLDKHFPNQLKLYQKYYPEYLQYLRGIAKSLNTNEKVTIKLFTTIYLPIIWQEKPGQNRCSTFAVNNKNGVFIGRNYDWRESSEQNSCFFKFIHSKVNSFKAVSDMGIWKVSTFPKPSTFVFITEDGWNNKGLYISLNGCPPSGETYGISSTHLIQLLLEKCCTTEQVLRLISKIPIPDTKIFTIADKNGNFAIVEKITNKINKIAISNKTVFTTNHYNHKSLTYLNEQIFDITPFHSTFARYKYLDIKLNKYFNKLNLKNIVKILNKPPVLQNWRGKANGDAVTCWSIVLNLKNNNFKLILGPLLKNPMIISE